MELFVGRDEEMAVLADAMERAATGAGGVVVVSGEPGIGKTRLAEELVRRASARGMAVAWGRSWEGLGTPAYWQWLQVLRALQLDLDAELAAAQSSDGHEARFRLFDVLAQQLVSRSRARPLAIVLDDVHAADVSSLLLLHFVARCARTAALLVVATSRDSWFHATAETSSLLAKIAREALHLPLGRLGLDDVTRWVAAAAPELAGRAERVFETSEGNPLFVEELVASARKRPGAAWTGQQMPHGIREAVRGHLALASESTIQVLAAASIHGRALRRGLDRAAIDEAIGLGIVDETGDGTLRFAHVLLRDELYAQLPAGRRLELHRAAAASATDPMAIAHHQLLGAEPHHAGLAVVAVTTAMEDATRRYAFEDAAQLGERALGVLAPMLAPLDECDLRIAVARACMLAGRKDNGFAICARAADLADTAGDALRLGQAALVASEVITLGRHESVVEMMRRALARLPHSDSAVRAHVMARLALAMVPPRKEEFDEAVRLRVESVAMARRVGDETTLFDALRLASYVYPETVPLGERSAFYAESIALAERLRQLPRVISMLWSYVGCQLENADLDAALREASAAERRLVAFRQPIYRWRAPLVHAMVAGFAGRFADADAYTREALRIAVEHELFEGQLMVGIARCSLQFNRGDEEGFADFAPIAFGTQLHARSTPGPYLAILHAVVYDIDSARRALDLGRDMPIQAMPGSASLGWAALRCGLVDHARHLYAIGRDHFTRMQLAFSPGGCMGPTPLLLGRLAAVAGDDARAEASYRDALAFCEAARARPYIAQTQLAWAELLARRGERDEASRRAEAARTIADELGMTRVAVDASRLLGGDAGRVVGDEPAKRGVRAPVPAPPSSGLVVLRRGALWALATGARELVLKDSKGLAYLEMLVRDPSREIHVLDLVGIEADGDAGPHLDARAKQAYRERADDLRGELEIAIRDHDLGRAERIRAELDQLGEELARAVGLGGRDRRAASQAERARINVQRRLRDVIRRVEEQDPDLARHLELSLKTGLFCSYVAVWPQPRA